MLTQKQAIDELRQCDHSFLKPEAVKELTEPFGFKGSTYMAKANPQDFKGLSLFDDNGNPIDEAEGQDAAVVARQIAKHLNVDVPAMFGRGSQLRAACDAIDEHLAGKS